MKTSIWVVALGLASAAVADVQVAVPADVLDDYRKFVAEKGEPTATTRDFKAKSARRDVVEVALFVQALKRAGFSEKIVFEPIDSYARIIAEIKSGRLAGSADPVWDADVEADASVVDMSPPVADEGECVVGLYTTKKNREALAARDLAAVRRLRAVTNRAWTRDWEALQSILPEASIMSVATWSSMPKMVEAGRVDFLLAPFQATPDLSLEVDGITLYPIPNVKLAVKGRRVFITKKDSPLSRALKNGLEQLKADGTVKRAYADAGFFNPTVESWTVLRRD